uniref:Pc4 n=1 Tax=Tenuivirus oryzabrevis TaxID=3052762 RepID=A0A0R5NGY4_9VIRU|nr:Pc4 [Tenuivirus oryzabrevis]
MWNSQYVKTHNNNERESIQLKLNKAKKDKSVFHGIELDYSLNDGMGYQVVDVSRCLSPWFGIRVIQELCSMHKLHITRELETLDVNGGVNYMYEYYKNLELVPASKNCGIIGLFKMSEPFKLFGKNCSVVASRKNKQDNFRKYILWESMNDLIVLSAYRSDLKEFRREALEAALDVLDERDYEYTPFTVPNYHLSDSGKVDPETKLETKSKMFQMRYEVSRSKYGDGIRGEDMWILRGQAFAVLVDGDDQFRDPYVIRKNDEENTHDDEVSNDESQTKLIVYDRLQFTNRNLKLKVVVGNQFFLLVTISFVDLMNFEKKTMWSVCLHMAIRLIHTPVPRLLDTMNDSMPLNTLPVANNINFPIILDLHIVAKSFISMGVDAIYDLNDATVSLILSVVDRYTSEVFYLSSASSTTSDDFNVGFMDPGEWPQLNEDGSMSDFSEGIDLLGAEVQLYLLIRENLENVEEELGNIDATGQTNVPYKIRLVTRTFCGYIILKGDEVHRWILMMNDITSRPALHCKGFLTL